MAIGTKAYLIVGLTAAGLGVTGLGMSSFISSERPPVQVSSSEPIPSLTVVERLPAKISTADFDVTEKRLELPGFGNSLKLVSQQVESADIVSTLSDLVPRTILESRIANALQNTTEVSFTDNPLRDGLAYLGDLHHIEFWIDERSIAEEGISLDQRVTIAKSELQLRSLLHLILERVGLTYLLANEMVVITTTQVAQATLETRVYDVSKIAQQIPTKELVEMIIGAGTDQKWEHDGSEGGSIFATKTALVIRQNYQAHEEILRLLIQLDRLTKHNDNKPKDPEKASAVPAKSI